MFGLPDERWGQRVCAALVPAADAGIRSPTASGRGACAPTPTARLAAVQAAQAVRGARRPAPDGDREGAARPDPRRWSTRADRSIAALPGRRSASGERSAILERMSPVDSGPPIATVNPANGELLQSFEPLDAAAVEARLATAAAGGARVGRHHLRRAVSAC